MNVTLSPEAEKIILQKLSSGEFATPDEAVSQAIVMMAEDEELFWKAATPHIEMAIAEADRGEFSNRTFDEIADGILRQYQA